MNWSSHSAGPGLSRTILLVVLALLAGAFAGTFFMDGGNAGARPSTMTTADAGAMAQDELEPRPVAQVTATVAAPVSKGMAPTAMRLLSGVGAVPPDFTLPDLFDDDTTYTLSAYRGQPVILNFWASWCVPCRREMPALQATAARYEEDGLLLLGMNQTYLDNLDAARAFVQELALTFRNTRDDSGAVGSEAFQVVGIPTTIFIDRDGAVAHIQIGEMSLEQVTTFTEQLMAGDPVGP